MTEEQLPLHKMSDEEIHDIAHQLAASVLHLRKKKGEFAEVKKEWTEEIKEIEKRILELSRILKEQEAARTSA